ncbi:phage holin, LLH family [Limosilactobacillus ingluviei]|uniref:phage holin, LLH family n=1 Tax=Limosilactobacillus ingluviei TaxID=148604 RepID=UPI00265E3B32|nr:phage holin, LLH family [Limosilactobacillus ingluviei]
MKTLNDIVNWIIQSGLLVWAFYFGFAVGKPWIDSKIKHAKTQQQKELWSLLEQIAMTAVTSLINSNKTGEQKFNEACLQVAKYLSDHGIKVDMQTVQAAVQAAYEKSPLTPGQSVDPVKEAIKSAPNRADKLLVTDGSITQAKG